MLFLLRNEKESIELLECMVKFTTNLSQLLEQIQVLNRVDSGYFALRLLILVYLNDFLASRGLGLLGSHDFLKIFLVEHHIFACQLALENHTFLRKQQHAVGKFERVQGFYILKAHIDTLRLLS